MTPQENSFEYWELFARCSESKWAGGLCYLHKDDPVDVALVISPSQYVAGLTLSFLFLLTGSIVSVRSTSFRATFSIADTYWINELGKKLKQSTLQILQHVFSHRWTLAFSVVVRFVNRLHYLPTLSCDHWKCTSNSNLSFSGLSDDFAVASVPFGSLDANTKVIYNGQEGGAAHQWYSEGVPDRAREVVVEVD